MLIFEPMLTSCSETYTMSNPDTKILGWGKSVQFFVHREVLIACSCYFEDVLLEGSSSDGSIATKKFAEEPLTLSLIIKFCYTQQYDICSDFDGRILNSTFLPSALKIHARVSQPLRSTTCVPWPTSPSKPSKMSCRV